MIRLCSYNIDVALCHVTAVIDYYSFTDCDITSIVLFTWYALGEVYGIDTSPELIRITMAVEGSKWGSLRYTTEETGVRNISRCFLTLIPSFLFVSSKPPPPPNNKQIHRGRSKVLTSRLRDTVSYDYSSWRRFGWVSDNRVVLVNRFLNLLDWYLLDKQVEKKLAVESACLRRVGDWNVGEIHTSQSLVGFDGYSTVYTTDQMYPAYKMYIYNGAMIYLGAEWRGHSNRSGERNCRGSRAPTWRRYF